MKSPGWKLRRAKLGLGLAVALAVPAMLHAQERGEIELGIGQRLPPAIAVVANQINELRELKPSSHWIGVVVRPCDDVIRTHLKLEGGLVVDEVTPDSPAAKAGIQKHDILLALNDASISDLKGLMNFLSENKEKVIVVKVLHAGEPKTVEVTPAERPQDQFKFFPADAFDLTLPEGKLPEELQRWMAEFGASPAKMRAWALEGEPFRARFVHPGVLIGEKANVTFNIEGNKLPDNLQVTVAKVGDKPAKITVKRGDDSWEVSEKELDKLPEDVRVHVQKFLGPTNYLGLRAETPKWAVPLDGDAPRVKIFATPSRVEAHAVRVTGPDVEKKLDEINGRLERIEKALEKLQAP